MRTKLNRLNFIHRLGYYFTENKEKFVLCDNRSGVMYKYGISGKLETKIIRMSKIENIVRKEVDNKNLPITNIKLLFRLWDINE